MLSILKWKITVNPLSIGETTMTEEEFRGFLSQLQNREGAIYLGPNRFQLVPTTWLTKIQQEMEEVLGPSGAYAVIYKASISAGEASSKALMAQVGDIPVEQKIHALNNIGRLQGWGTPTLLEYKEKPLHVKIKFDNTYLSGLWKDADEAKCLYLSSFIGIMLPIFKEAGLIETELEYEETKCVAKGDPHCEFVVRNREW
jgi:hypothetical protein